MPSPFPGMDPYLEGDLWHGFVGELGTMVRRDLASKLGPKYFPFCSKYFVTETRNDLLTWAGIPEEIPHYRIEIRDLADQNLVTVIEFLSATNKHGSGTKKYLKKRRGVLLSSVHLIEIDLLLRGPRLPMGGPYPAGDYFVMLSRVEERPLVSVWPILLGQPLPTIPIPLRVGDLDVDLSLQGVFQKNYDLGGYQGIIEYSKPPEVPLTEEQQKLVREILAKNSDQDR